MTPGTPKSPLAAVFLTVVIDLLGFGLVLPLLPLYGTKYGASGVEVGLLFASFSAMQFLTSPVWGRISDRVGRRPVILLGLCGSTASYALFGLADEFGSPLAVLFASRLMAGAFGGTISTAYAYIADVTPDRERGRGMALVGAAFGIGFTLGPAIGGLSHRLSPAAPGLLAAAFSATAFLFAFFRLPEPARHRPSEAGKAIGALRAALAVPGVPRILLLTLLAHGTFALFESTLALLAERRFHFDPTQNGWLFSYVGFCYAIAQGVLVRRWIKAAGERALAIAGGVTLGAGLLAVGFAPGAVLLLLAAPLPVLGFAMMNPSLASLLSRRTDPATQGGTLGVNQSCASLARILGPVSGNVLLAGHLRGPHYAGAAVMLVATLLALGLSSPPPPISPPPG
jgi:MFS family permease